MSSKSMSACIGRLFMLYNLDDGYNKGTFNMFLLHLFNRILILFSLLVDVNPYIGSKYLMRERM